MKAGRRKLSHLVEALPVLMRGRADVTIRKTQAALCGLMDAAGNIDLPRLNRRHLMEWRSARLSEVATATVNSGIRHAKSALTYAVDAGFMKINPAMHWRGMLITEPEKQIRVVEADEFALLLDSADQEFSAYLGLCFLMGFRRTEACNVRWPAIRFRSNLIHVMNLPSAGELTKNRKNRDVPFRRRARSLLWSLHQTKSKLRQPLGGHVFINAIGRAWQPDTAGRRFSVLVEQIGIPKCTIHDLRRSFSTHAQRRGIDVATVMRLGGWSNEAVVRKHYTGDLGGLMQHTMAHLDATEGDPYATYANEDGDEEGDEEGIEEAA